MPKRIAVFFFAVAFALWECSIVFAVAPFGPYEETQTITVDSPMPFEGIGFSLVVSDGMLITGAINSENEVGSDVGSAFVYRNSASGFWNSAGQIFASDNQHNHAFGHAVGLDGDYAIVGATGHDHPSSGVGSAYIFHRRSDDVWEQLNEFAAPPDSSNFGSHLDLEGAHAAVSGQFRVNLGSLPVGRRDFIEILTHVSPSTSPL